MKRRPAHLPMFNPLELETVLARLDASNLSEDGKRLVREMLNAAANEQAESTETVVATLPTERRANILAHTQALQHVQNAALARARLALDNLPDDEWNELLEDADAD